MAAKEENVKASTSESETQAGVEQSASQTEAAPETKAETDTQAAAEADTPIEI